MQTSNPPEIAQVTPPKNLKGWWAKIPNRKEAPGSRMPRAVHCYRKVDKWGATNIGQYRSLCGKAAITEAEARDPALPVLVLTSWYRTEERDLEPCPKCAARAAHDRSLFDPYSGWKSAENVEWFVRSGIAAVYVPSYRRAEILKEIERRSVTDRGAKGAPGSRRPLSAVDGTKGGGAAALQRGPHSTAGRAKGAGRSRSPLNGRRRKK